jgi:hypothetical protein
LQRDSNNPLSSYEKHVIGINASVQF